MSVLSPFLIAGIIACILNRPIRFMSEESHIKKPFICVPVVVLCFIIIGFAFSVVGAEMIEEMKKIAAALPSLYTEAIFPFLEEAAGTLERLLPVFHPKTGEMLSILMQSLREGIMSASAFLLNGVIGVVAYIPSIFPKTVVTIIATIFITIDFERIKAFMKRQMPDDRLQLVIAIVRNIIEPKLVGKQIGLHPIVTFAGMLIGLKYFGFLGMLGIPLAFAFIYRLNEKKIVTFIK